MIASGHAGTLFMVPGRDETLRVSGPAQVVTDEWLLNEFTEYRQPKSAIVVRADEVFVHCAKAYRRGGVWAPDTWPTDDVPDIASIVMAQRAVPEGVTADDIRTDLEAGYQHDLANDRA